MPNNQRVLNFSIIVHCVLGFLKFLSFVVAAQNGVTNGVVQKIESLKQSIVDIFTIDQALLDEAGIVINNNVASSNLSNNNNARLAENEGPENNNNEGPHENNDDEASDHPLSPVVGSPTPDEQGVVVDDQIRAWGVMYHEYNAAVANTQFWYLLLSTPTQNNSIIRESYVSEIFYAAIEVMMVRSRYVPFNRWNLADALTMLGNQAMRCLNYVKAIDMYTAAIALWKNNAMYLCLRGKAFLKAGFFVNAIIDLDESVRLEPRYKIAHYLIGCAYLKLGKNFEAINEGFMKALPLEPMDYIDDVMQGIEIAEMNIMGKISRVKEQTYDVLVPNGKERPSGKVVWVPANKEVTEKKESTYMLV